MTLDQLIQALRVLKAGKRGMLGCSAALPSFRYEFEQAPLSALLDVGDKDYSPTKDRLNAPIYLSYWSSN